MATAVCFRGNTYFFFSLSNGMSSDCSYSMMLLVRAIFKAISGFLRTLGSVKRGKLFGDQDLVGSDCDFLV